MRKIIGAVAASMALAACGSSDEGTIRTDDGEVSYSADRDGDSVTIEMEGPDGEQATVRTGAQDAGDVDLPDGFTVYPGASVDSHMSINAAGGSGSVVSMTSSDSPADVIAFYREQAEAAGITISAEANSNGVRVIGGEGAGGMALSLSASPNGEGGTTIQLSVGGDD